MNKNLSIVLCRSKAQYRFVMQYFADKGYCWSSRTPLMSRYYAGKPSADYECETAIYLYADNKTVMRSDLAYALSEYFDETLIEAVSLMELTTSKPAPNLPQL